MYSSALGVFDLEKADLEDKSSLRAALKDAHTVFGVTNFHELMSKEREIQQGKNLADICKVNPRLLVQLQII